MPHAAGRFVDNRSPKEAEPADVPAIVHDYSANGFKLAAVTHPAGSDHPNAMLTRERLRRKGYTIVKVRA